MPCFSLDHLVILYIFILLLLVVGLYVGRNVKTMKDYAIANKNL